MTGIDSPPIDTVAVTGPSDVSSYQSSALLKLSGSFGLNTGAPDGEADLPVPPRTSRRPASSVRISPSGTVVVLNLPVSNRCAAPPETDFPVIERGPGSIASAVAVGEVRVAQGHRHRHRFGNVERGLELVPLRLAVHEVHRPFDVGICQPSARAPPRRRRCSRRSGTARPAASGRLRRRGRCRASRAPD